jgi:hypothetical protein
MAEFHQKNVEAFQFLLRSDNRNERVISASINFNQILSDREDLMEFNRRENFKTLDRFPVLLMRSYCLHLDLRAGYRKLEDL